MRNRVSNLLWGLFFIALGLVVAAKILWNVDIFFDGWWTLFIIIPFFIGMIKSRFGIGSTIGFIIGVLLFLSCQPGLGSDIRKLMLPIILVFIGIRIIFQNVFGRNRIHYRRIEQNGQVGPDGQEIHMEGSADYTNIPEYNATFGENNLCINEQFNGCSLNSVFGSINLDLRGAMINQDVEINATVIFAGIDIIVPPGVNVKINSIPIFGGVSDKSGRGFIQGAPTIYLNSTCMFGGIDIK